MLFHEPISQNKHSCIELAPRDLLYDPTGHFEHSKSEVLSANVPHLHDTQDDPS